MSQEPSPPAHHVAVPHPGPRDWVNLIGLVAIWGSAFALITVALRSFQPIEVVAGRIIIGAAFLLVVMALRGSRLARRPGAWGLYTVMAVLGNALPFFLIAWGQQRVPSGVAGILMAVMPLTVVVLARFLLPGERLDAWRITGFVLGFVGLVLLTGPEALLQFRGEGAVFWSQLAILGGAVCYGLNVIVARRFPLPDALATSAGVLLVAGIITGGVAGVVADDINLAGIPGWHSLALLALGVLATGAATVLYYHIINTAGATFLALINYLIPVWAVLIGIVFLGERLTAMNMVALAVILTGIFLSRHRRTPG